MSLFSKDVRRAEHEYRNMHPQIIRSSYGLACQTNNTDYSYAYGG